MFVYSFYTYKLQISISGPYFLRGTNSSGAAYSNDPQCVNNKWTDDQILLNPKSKNV